MWTGFFKDFDEKRTKNYCAAVICLVNLHFSYYIDGVFFFILIEKLIIETISSGFWDTYYDFQIFLVFWTALTR